MILYVEQSNIYIGRRRGCGQGKGEETVVFEIWMWGETRRMTQPCRSLPGMMGVSAPSSQFQAAWCHITKGFTKEKMGELSDISDLLSPLLFRPRSSLSYSLCGLYLQRQQGVLLFWLAYMCRKIFCESSVCCFIHRQI